MYFFKIKLFKIITILNFILNAHQLYAQDIKSADIQGPLSSNWSCFKTNNPNLTIKEVEEKFLAGQFKPLENKILNAGIANRYYWIHFSIENLQSDKPSFLIDIDNARLNKIELFELRENTVKSLGKLGDQYPFSKRLIPHKNFIYPISLKRGERNDYFLFADQLGHAFTLPIKILKEEKFVSDTYRDYIFDGLTYGILLFVTIMSLLFFYPSRHSLYLYYSLYILSAIGWFLSYFGLGYQYIWPNSPALNTALPPFMAASNILLNLQICSVLLNLSTAGRSLYQASKIVKHSLIAVALFPLYFDLNKLNQGINHAYLAVFLILIIIAMVIVMISVFYHALKGSMVAKVYFTASVLKGCSIINLALLELGITPAIYNLEGFLQAGIFIEITLLTFALASRYTYFKVRSFEKVIEAHEKERFVISKEIHDCISNTITGINYAMLNFIQKNSDLSSERKCELEKINLELSRMQIEARNISHNTMPDYIQNKSITDIVGKYVEEVQSKVSDIAARKRNLTINFSSNEQVFRFSEAVKLNIFRIVQELVTNIIKHSKASNADLLFSFGKTELMVIAEDNGIGFKEADTVKKGMGLKNVRSRLELLEGTLYINSSPAKLSHKTADNNFDERTMASNHGTIMKIKIPYKDHLINQKNDYRY